jgi:O-antigen ligase
MDIFQLIMGSAAFFGAIAVVIGLALAVHWGRNREVGLMPYFYYLSLLYAGLYVLMSNRDVSIPIEFLRTVAVEVKSPLITILGRLTSLFVILAFTERLLQRILSNRQKPDISYLLFFGLTSFFLTNIVSPALFGSHPIMSHEYFYAFIALCGCLLMNAKEADISFKSARNGLYVFFLVGLICMVVKPQLVLNTFYVGLIPFLRIRLAGLAMHPNGLGVLSALYLICVWHVPFKNRLINISALVIGYANLILSQSKTCWIAYFFCVAIIYYYSYGHLIKQHFLNYRRPHFSVLIISTVLTASLAVCIAFMFFGVGDRIADFFNTRTGSELASFSGRDIIWQIALEEWHKSPIFGYGLTLWDEDFRRSIQLANATSAHSQFYQSLAVSGLVGEIGLVIYLCILTYFAFITAKKSKGLTLAIYFLMMSGCFSEVPLVMESFGSSPIVAHSLLLIALSSAYLAQREKVRDDHPMQNSMNFTGTA